MIKLLPFIKEREFYSLILFLSKSDQDMTFSVNWMGWISEKMPMTVCVRNTQLAQEIAKKGINRIGWAFLSIQFAIPKRSKGECGRLRDNGNTRDQ